MFLEGEVIVYFLGLGLFGVGTLFGMVVMYYLRKEHEDHCYMEGFHEGVYVERKAQITGEQIIQFRLLQNIKKEAPK
jgi:hypothetical protein